MICGAASAAPNVIIVPEVKIEAPREVYVVQMIGRNERRTPFDLNRTNGIWSTTLPTIPAARGTVVIRYATSVRPEALRLELWIKPNASFANLILPRPRPAAQCNLDDLEDLINRTLSRAEARDAAGIIVQIDHLFAIRDHPCARRVREELARMRDENMQFLRWRMPAIRNLQGM